MAAKALRDPSTAPRRKSTSRKAVSRVGQVLSTKAAAKGKVMPKATAKAKVVRKIETASSNLSPMSFRIDIKTRALIDRAATVSGQNRTDFMLMAARDRATEVLLNQRLFSLAESDWDAFARDLDAPPPPNAKLKVLLSQVPIWDH